MSETTPHASALRRMAIQEAADSISHAAMTLAFVALVAISWYAITSWHDVGRPTVAATLALLAVPVLVGAWASWRSWRRSRRIFNLATTLPTTSTPPTDEDV